MLNKKYTSAESRDNRAKILKKNIKYSIFNRYQDLQD